MSTKFKVGDRVIIAREGRFTESSKALQVGQTGIIEAVEGDRFCHKGEVIIAGNGIYVHTTQLELILGGPCDSLENLKSAVADARMDGYEVLITVTRQVSETIDI